MAELLYVGPDGATSDRYGVLVRGRVYQESDETFAAYLAAQHPDHWQIADRKAAPKGRSAKE